MHLPSDTLDYLSANTDSVALRGNIRDYKNPSGPELLIRSGPFFD